MSKPTVYMLQTHKQWLSLILILNHYKYDEFLRQTIAHISKMHAHFYNNNWNTDMLHGTFISKGHPCARNEP